MIDLLKDLGLLILISGFTFTFALAIGFAFVSCTRSAEDTRSEW